MKVTKKNVLEKRVVCTKLYIFLLYIDNYGWRLQRLLTS